VFRAFLQSLAAFALLVAFGVILAIHAGGPTMVDGAALARLEPAALGAALLLVAWFANGVLGVALALRLMTSALFALSVNFVPAARLARALERPGVRRVLQFIIGATLVQQAVLQSAQAAGSPHHTVAGFASTPPVSAMVQTQPQGHPASVTQAAALTAHRARAEADCTFFAPEKEDVAAPATHAEIAATSAVSAVSAVDIHATHDQAPAPPVSQAAHAAQSAPVVQVRTMKEVRLIVRDAPALAFTVGFGGMHLAQVSDAIYGNPNGAARIAAANPGLAPGGLVAEGTMLRVPLDGMNAQSALVKVAGDHVNYTIQEGDTLSRIAQTFTGNWRNYVHLGAINTDTITDDNLIYTGNTLRLPADVLTHYTQRARLVTTVRVKTTIARPAESAARHMAAPAAVVHHEAAPLSTVVHHATAPVHAEAAPVRHAAPVRRRAPHFTRLAHHVAHHAAATATGAGDGVAATWGFAPPPAETVASGTSGGGSVNTKHAAAHHLIVRTREIMGQGPTTVTQAAFHPTHAVDALRHEAPAHDVAQTPHAHADQGLPIGATMRGALNDVTQSLHELPSVTDGSTNRAIPTTLGAAMLALLGLLLFARRRRVFTAVNVGAISPMGEGMRAAVGDVLAGRRGKAEKAVREKLPSDQGNKVVAALHLLESVGLDPSLICSVTEGKSTLVLAYDISDELDRHTFLTDIEAKLPRALKASAKLERGIATFTLRSDPVLAETPPRAHPVPLLVPLGEGADDVVLHLNMARAGSALIAGGMSRDGAAPLAANILVNVVSQDPLGERVKIIAATADPIVAEAIAALPHLAAPVVDANDAQAVEALVHDVYAIVRDNWHPQPSDPTYLVLIEGVDRLSDLKVLDGLVGQAAESKVHIIACANVVNALLDKKATSKFATRIARPLGETEAEVLFGRQGMPAGLLTNEAMVSAFGALARVKPFGIGPELVREHLAQVVAYTLAVAAVGTTASVPDEDMSEDDVLPNTTATAGVLSSTTDVTDRMAPTMEAQASRDDEGEAASGDVVVASLSEAPESVFANMEADREAARLAALARSAEVERLTANLIASPSVDVPPPLVASHETVAPMAATEFVPVVPSVMVAETMTDGTGADRVGEIEIVETKAADVASPTDALTTVPRADAGEEMGEDTGEDTRGNMDEDVDGRDDGWRTPPTPREPAPTGEGDTPLTPFTWAAAPDDGLVSVPDVLPTAPVSDETLAALAQGDRFVDAHVPHGIATLAQPSNDEPTLSFELAAADQVPAQPQTPAILAPAPDVEMTLIGDTTLRINGEVVQLRPQSLSILAALVYYGPKPLKKRWFVDQLWRGEAAAANSRRAFSTLKGELAAIPALAGHDLLQMTESSVGVNQALVSTDIYPIKKLYDAGRGLVGPERLEIEEQFQAIYTDDLFGVKGAKGYEWAFEDIARYREFSLLAKQHIAHALDEGGQWEAALTLATELLAIDSEKESHQILMLGILSGNGLFEEAIRHYQDYVALLARAEPPREPGTRITQIYARTLKKAAAARTAASARTQAGRRPTTDTQVADTVTATTTTTAVAAQERSRVGV